MTTPTNDAEYKLFLTQIKNQIVLSQHRAMQSVNRHLIWLYWNIGTSILQKQDTEGWGSKIIEQLANDIQKSFPSLKGFSYVIYFNFLNKGHMEYPYFERLVSLKLSWVFHPETSAI